MIHSYCLLTNFSNELLSVYKEAIKEYKRQGGGGNLFIEPYAFDNNGAMLNDYSSIYGSSTHINHKMFWKIFDMFRKRQRMQMEFIIEDEMIL